MGRAMQVIVGRVANPSTTFTAWTVGAGDSLTVATFNPSSRAYLEEVWALQATAGQVRIRSPRMHDNVQGIRLLSPVSLSLPLLAREVVDTLWPGDPLTVEMTGGGAETDCGALLIYYDDLPGIDARLASWEEVEPRVENIVSVLTTHTTGSTAGDYGGSLALNATDDRLKSNTDYALLGYQVDTTVLAVGYRGPDVGNYRVGGPAAIRPDVTAEWFVRLARLHGKPHIPIINAQNKGATLVDLVHTATGATVNVVTHFAELSGSALTAGR